MIRNNELSRKYRGSCSEGSDIASSATRTLSRKIHPVGVCAGHQRHEREKGFRGEEPYSVRHAQEQKENIRGNVLRMNEASCFQREIIQKRVGSPWLGSD